MTVAKPSASAIRIVAIADTHGFHHRLQIPDGDILIHAGDLTDVGRLQQLADVAEFLHRLPHKHIFVVAGNHDFCFERQPEAARRLMGRCVYLHDETVDIEGLTIHGSPWTPEYKHWALALPRGEALVAKWDMIPAETDILVTHAAPRGIGDAVGDGTHVGCDDLRDAIDRVQPTLHIFGHIHHSAGIYRRGASTLINASICNEAYRPVNRALVLDLPLP